MGKERVKTTVSETVSKIAERRLAHRETRLGVHSIEIGMSLVDALICSSGPLSLKELSRVTQLNASKAHRYLASFVRTGLITQNPETGQYDLGPLALRLGYAAQHRTDSLRVTLAGVERLVRETGHTAMASAWSERGPAIIRWVQGTYPVYTTLSVGATLPLLSSATGRIFLTYLENGLTRTRVRQEMKGGTKADIRVIREQVCSFGFAEVGGDFIPGLSACAAPVFDVHGALASVLTIVSTVSIGWQLEARRTLLRISSEVSRELGWNNSK